LLAARRAGRLVAECSATLPSSQQCYPRPVIRLRSSLLLVGVLALAPACASPNQSDTAERKRAEQPSAAAEEAPAAMPAEAEPAVDADIDAVDRREAEPAPAPGGPPPSAGGARRDAAPTRSESSSPAATTSRLVIAEPAVNGGLNRDLIRRKAMDHDEELRACHAHAPDFAGSIVVKLQVDARGLVKDVELGDEGTIGNRALETCVLELISSWSFAGDATSKASVELRFDLVP
jgi:hypothetical protein